MKTKLTALFSVVALLFISGCASTSEGEAHSSATQPLSGHYRTFAILNMPMEGPASDPGAPARLAKPAREAVAAALVAKGYSEAPPETADLHVKMSAYFTPDLLSETTEKRQLIIEILDSKTGKRVWWDQRERSSSVTMTPEYLQKQLTQALQPFPSVSQLPQ